MKFPMLTGAEVTFLFLLFSHSNAIDLDYTQECVGSECTPRSGNLLIGRANFIEASSTCGMGNTSTVYCVYTMRDGIPRAESCDLCHSKERYTPSNTISHQVENLVHDEYPLDEKRWWQSENGVENVTLKLSLETEYLFISTRLSFRTYVPAAMYIEKSVDGTTWTKLAYFSNDCKRDFPDVPARPRKFVGDVTCTSHLSSHVISRNGLVEFSLTPPQLVEGVDIDPYQLLDLQKFDSLQIQFVRLNKLGDEYVDKSKNADRKYYYAVQEWIVQGRCSCNGHAAHCIALHPTEDNNSKMVQGKCVCVHNTAGDNCEFCQDFYLDVPWRPAIGANSNECRECNCNGHAKSCRFNDQHYVHSGNKTGGMCEDCTNNTVGNNCDQCENGFYRNPTVPITSEYTCLPCDCYGPGTNLTKQCQPEKLPDSELPAGQCDCRRYVVGRRCDSCAPGYWNLQENNPDGCEKCNCERLGTPNNAGCDQQTGVCACKPNVWGSLCNQCKPGFYNLSTHADGCQECNCHEAGTLSGESCEPITGACQCRPGFEGRDCSRIKDSWYVSIISTVLQPVGAAYPVIMKPPRQGGLFYVVLHLNVTDFKEQEAWEIQLSVVQRPHGNECQHDPRNEYIRAGERFLIFPAVCISNLSQAQFVIESLSTSPVTKGKVDILLVQVFPLKVAPVDHKFLMQICEPYRYQLDDIPPSCNEYPLDRLTDVVAYNEIIAQECGCDYHGAMSNLCNKFSGQCKCKLGVRGRTCNQCMPNHYGFSMQGCKKCDCDPTGSESNDCHPRTGVCKCRPRYTGVRCDQCEAMHYNYPECTPCDCNNMASACNSNSGECIGCKENTDGEKCQYCKHGFYGDPIKNLPCLPCNCSLPNNMVINNTIGCGLWGSSMQCYCNEEDGYTGDRCDRCLPGFYGNPLRGKPCRKCECNDNIDMNDPDSCNQDTGKCLKCLRNTDGPQCDKCIEGYYQNPHIKGVSCVKCVCNARYTKPNTFCHPLTGQCQCIENAVGRDCDGCMAEHYYSLSLKSCVFCNCSKIGSEKEQCDKMTGDCKCRPKYGGRRCDECPENEWGLPGMCKKCDCEWKYAEGCNKKDGTCVCSSSFHGPKCDRCSDNTEGDFPNCKECGPCYDGWKQELQRLISFYNVSMGVNISTIAYQKLLLLLEQRENAQCGPLRCRDLLNYLLKVQEIIKRFPEDTESAEKLLRDLLNEEKELLNFLNTTLPRFSQRFVDIRRNITSSEYEINQLLNKIPQGAKLIGEFALNETDEVNNEWNELTRLRHLLGNLQNQLGIRNTSNGLNQNISSLLNELRTKLDSIESKLCGLRNIDRCDQNMGDVTTILNSSLAGIVDLGDTLKKDASFLEKLLAQIQVKIEETRIQSLQLLQRAEEIRKQDNLDKFSYGELLSRVEAALNNSQNISDKALQDLEKSIKAITDQNIDLKVAHDLANRTSELLKKLSHLENIIKETQARRSQAEQLLGEALQLRNETARIYLKSKELQEKLKDVGNILRNMNGSLEFFNQSIQSNWDSVNEIEVILNETMSRLDKSSNNLENVNGTLNELEKQLFGIERSLNNTAASLSEAELIILSLPQKELNRTSVNWSHLEKELNQTSATATKMDANLSNLQQSISDLENAIGNLNSKMDLDKFEDVEKVIRMIAFETILTCNVASTWTE